MDIPPQVKDSTSTCSSPLSYQGASILIIASCLLGILWSIYNYLMIKRIDLQQQADSDSEALIEQIPANQKRALLELGYKISDGTLEYVKQEYFVCMILVMLTFVLVLFLSEQKWLTALAYFVGAFVSMICGVVGVIVATQSNYRVAYCSRFGLAPTFQTAYKASCSIGFGLASLALLSLMIVIQIFKQYYDLRNSSPEPRYYLAICEAIVGYGLGASFVALIGRLGSGVFSQAAEIGAQLVGKVDQFLLKESSNNPCTITMNVGDNIGDIGGMTADLFGSLSEAICAALVLSCTSIEGWRQEDGCELYLSNLMYPIVLVALSILVCILVSAVATNILWIEQASMVAKIVRLQLAGSSLLLVGFAYLAAFLTFPDNFKVNNIYGNYYDIQQPWVPYLCSLMGILAVPLIYLFTQFMTSSDWFPVQALLQNCKTSSAGTISLGLALGYLGTIIPVIVMAVTAYFSCKLLGFYGMSLAVLGMLSNLPLIVAVNVFGPISSNASAMINMVQLGQQSKQRINALTTIGTLTTSTGKATSIATAALLALSLFGGFLRNASLDVFMAEEKISLTEPLIFSGLLLGAMLPFFFTALIIRSVSNTSFWIAEEIRRQITEDEGIIQGTSFADFISCVRVAARGALIQIALPSALIIGFPLALGFGIGPKIVAGFMPGVIVSGLHLAISGAVSGAAWDSAKEFIESGKLMEEDGRVIVKGSPTHKVSLIAKSVGEPLKDATALSLNILMKLPSMLCLIFANEFLQLHP